MSRRAASLFFACAAAGTLAYAGLVRGPQGGPIDAVPAGSFLVAQLDVAALRSSPLYTSFVEKEGAFGGVRGFGDLALACGFDPLTRLQELDLAVPEGGDPGDFGLAVSATLTRDELVRCAENLAGTRGEARPVEQVGRFYLSGDGKGHALAVADRGPILVGKAPWVRAMIDAAERRAPGVRQSKEHMELRDALGSASAARPMMMVTLILPRDLRERLKREMGSEQGGTPEAMAGILGVSSAGFAVRSGQGGTLEARLELRCESDASCAAVSKLILAKRLAWSQDLALRLVGLGPLIDALEVNAHGTALTATTRAHDAELAQALDRFGQLGKNSKNSKDKGGAPSSTAPGSPATAAPRAPDEVLRPHREDRDRRSPAH